MNNVITFLQRLAIIISILTYPLPLQAENVIFTDDFSHATDIDDPWIGVNSQGEIVLPTGKQLQVDDSGNIESLAMSPSIAVGDLNGDGLLDLVVADSVGFFWYIENHGTPTAPKFDPPQLMPIWIGDPCPDYWNQTDIVTNNTVPRIQLIDLDGSGKLDLVIGSYIGKLFVVRNEGSKTAPVFRMPSNLDDITLATHNQRKLWCNYLSPFLCDWQRNGHLDLIVGDGSYSANSIYFFKNKGRNDNPEFSENSSAKVIPGMGREGLVPQVVSWNGRAKPDILCSERQGFLDLFQFQGTDASTGYPKFDEGQHISVGERDRLPERSTVTVAYLTDAKLPDLIIGTPDGRISLAKNVGAENSYKFNSPQPLVTGARPHKIHRLNGWTIDGGYGLPDGLLVSTNARDEHGFTAPDSGLNSALKCYIQQPAVPSPVFPVHFDPRQNGKVLFCGRSFEMKAGSRYKVSFWIKNEGDIRNMTYTFYGVQREQNGAIDGYINKTVPVDVSGAWNHYSSSVSFDSLSTDEGAKVNFDFHLDFEGKGALYLAGFKFEQDD